MEAPVEQKGEVTMKLGICEWVLPIKGPSLFPKLKELGIDGIQVDDWDGHAACNPMCDPYVQSLYLENADKYGIEMISMGGNALGKEGGMIHAPYSAVGEQCMDTFRHGIDACHAMNIPVYLAPAFFAGFPMTVKDRENIALNLRTACEYAEDKNVCVAFESAYSAEQVIALAEEVSHPNFRVFYDTQNPATFCGICVAEDIIKLGRERIVQIHIKDGVESIHGSVYLGTGDTGFRGAAEAIRKIGYDGWLVLENSYSKPHFRSNETDPWERIAMDVKLACELFKQTAVCRRQEEGGNRLSCLDQ